MDRRSFLLGSAALAAATAVPRVGGAALAGTDVMTVGLVDYMPVSGLSQKMSHVTIYGNAEFEPVQFTGFTPSYDCLHDAT